MALSGIVALTRPTPPEAVRATMVLLVVHLLLWAGTGAALRPALTGPEPWVGQLRHARPGQPRYPGTLSDVRINGVPVENDPLATIPRPSGSVDFGFTTALPVDSLPASPVTIARIVDGHQQPVVGVGARGHDATFEVRLQASRWRLRTPGWRFPGALAISPATPWSFHWRLLHDRIEMRDGAVGGPERVDRLPLSLGIGWIFVHPFVSVVGPGAPWWTVAWLGWWFALLGWFGGATGRWLGAGAGAAGLLLLLVVARADTLPVLPLEGATAMIATVAGLLLGRRHAARSG